MDFIKVFLMVFIPIVVALVVYWCFKNTSAHSKIILQAHIAVQTRLKSPSYIKFSPLNETTVTGDDNTWTVKGWVEYKTKSDDIERHEYSVDVIAIQWKPGQFRYETEFLTIK